MRKKCLSATKALEPQTYPFIAAQIANIAAQIAIIAAQIARHTATTFSSPVSWIIQAIPPLTCK